MKILNDLLAMRKSFDDEDRKEAMPVLMRRIYYEIAPRVTSGDTFTLFRDEADMSGFCHNNNLDIRGLRALLAMMNEDGLVSQNPYLVVLTQLGVQKLCV